MAGTFVATPSKALTIEHEPTGRALTQFKPEEIRGKMDTLDTLIAYGVQLRDDSKLRELAIKKLELVVDIVDWLAQNMRGAGQPPKELPTGRHNILSTAQALEALGYAPTSLQVIVRWRQLAKEVEKDTERTVTKIVNGWKIRAGLIAAPEPKEKVETDRDIAVEAIFRAYTKLDPDQRIELKEKIMAFEKSYKDPFAPKER